MHEYPSSPTRHVHLGWYPYRIGTWIVIFKPVVEVRQTCGECFNHLHYIHHTRIFILTSWLPNSPIPLVISWSSWPLVPSIIQCSQLMTIGSGVSLYSTIMAYMVCSWTFLWFWRWSLFGFRPDRWLVVRLVQHPLLSHILLLLHIGFLNNWDNYNRLFGLHKLHLFGDVHNWTAYSGVS